MSKNVQIVDILKASPGAANIQVQDKQGYATAYIETDFEDDELPNWRSVKSYADAHGGGAGSGLYIQIKIDAGTAIPFNIDLSDPDYTGFDVRVAVTTEIYFNDDTATLVEYTDILKVKNYVDDTLAGISSIDIYGHDDGAGTFTEDTYVTLRQ